MSRKANSVAVGIFVVLTVTLATVLLVLFSGNPWWSPKQRFVLLYDSSIHGLNVGAPVTLKGVRVGQVSDIYPRLYGDNTAVLNTVTIEIDESILKDSTDDSSPLSAQTLIDRGLRAQLRQQSLLTGLLYVDVDFEPNKPRETKPFATDYPQLPTTPTNLEQLSRDLEAVDLNALMSDLQLAVNGASRLLNDPELQQLAGNLNASLEKVDTTVQTLERTLGNLASNYSAVAGDARTFLSGLESDSTAALNKINETLDNLQSSTEAFETFADNAAFLSSDDSPLLYNLNNAATGLNQASDQLRELSNLLNRKPEVLIYGRTEEE